MLTQDELFKIKVVSELALNLRNAFYNRMSITQADKLQNQDWLKFLKVD